MLAFIKSFSSNYNTVWAGRSLGIWTAVEMDVAIICCCLPPLRPLVSRAITRTSLDKGLEQSRSYLSNLFRTDSAILNKTQREEGTKDSAGCPSSMLSSLPVSGTATPDPKSESGEDKITTSWLSMTETIYENEGEDENDFLNNQAFACGRIGTDNHRFVGSAV